MRLLRNMLMCAACSMFLIGYATQAQQPAQNQPAGASSDTDMNATPNADQSAAVNQPLSGVQNLSLAPEATRSYWQPHIDAYGSADSNAQETGDGRNWTTWTSGSAGADIYRVTGISNTELSFTSGGMYSNGNQGIGNGSTEGLSFSEKVSFRRSTLAFFDQASYLPESSFGFGGLGGAGVSGITLSAPGMAFTPGQSILTGRGQTLNSTSAVELDELFTPRSSLSLSGGYSLLHYFGSESNLIDYGVVNARVGYNYQITRRDKFAIIYTFGDYRYANSGQSMIAHTMQASYGRVVNQKLVFQVAAGPQAVFSTTAGTLGTGGTTAPLISQTQVLWSLNTNMAYQERRYSFGASYNHGVSGGSGVLVGAQMDTASGFLTRQMSRTFSSGFTGGYSRTDGLSGTGAASAESYGYWFGGLNLTKPLGPTVGLTASYEVQYQTSNSAACVGPTCGQNILRHMISVGIGWHERPLLF
jgi:hypothetical protein